MERQDPSVARVASIVELCTMVDDLLATSSGEIRMTQLKERVRWFHRKRLDQHALGYRTLVELFDHTDLAAKFALEGPLNQLTLVWRRDVDLYTTTPPTTTTTTKCARTLRGMCSWPLLEGQDLVTLPNVGSYRRTRGGRLRTAAKLSSGGERMQPSLPHLAQRAEWMLLLQRQQSLQPQQPEQQPQQELQEQQPLPPMEVQPHLSLQVFHQWQHRQQQQLQQLQLQLQQLQQHQQLQHKEQEQQQRQQPEPLYILPLQDTGLDQPRYHAAHLDLDAFTGAPPGIVCPRPPPGLEHCGIQASKCRADEQLGTDDECLSLSSSSFETPLSSFEVMPDAPGNQPNRAMNTLMVRNTFFAYTQELHGTTALPF